MQNNFQSWVDAVCDCVRFRPDRKQIEKELRTQYGDHYQDLIRLNYAPELAAQRALEAMGDPREVGRALDRVHKPWLGWLWEFSQCMLLLLVIIFDIAVSSSSTVDAFLRTKDQLAWTDPPAGAVRMPLEYADVCLAPGEIRETDGHIEVELLFWVEAGNPFQQKPEPGWLKVADDRGPLSWQQRDENGDWQTTGYWKWDSDGVEGWTRWQNKLLLILDYTPRWAELSAPDGSWTLRAEWGDGS